MTLLIIKSMKSKRTVKFSFSILFLLKYQYIKTLTYDVLHTMLLNQINAKSVFLVNIANMLWHMCIYNKIFIQPSVNKF